MEVLKNIWYFAAWSDEIVEGEVFARIINSFPIIIMRKETGEAVAMADRCPHRFAPLSMGKIKNGNIVCPYHGLEFNMEGKCAHNPHPSGKIPKKADVDVFPTHERHTGVWVWMGDAEKADPALIPDFGKLDPDQLGHGVTRRDHFVMDAPYDLIIDNLLDCSHLCFVHDGILGNLEMANTPTEIKQNNNTINVIRYSKDVPPPGMFDMIYRRDGKNVDFWTDFRWDPPGCLLLDVGVCPPGETTRDNATGYYSVHFITPETEDKTHYFTAACRWNISPESQTDEMRIKIADLRRFAFEEQDEPLIIAQHEVRKMSDPADLEPVLLETDAGVVRWRRIYDQLRAKEMPEQAEQAGEVV